MGAFYGSILIRSDERDRIAACLGQLATDRKCKFLLGPSLKGWTSVFPCDSGQDESLSGEIAQVTGADIFHLMVHDDDIFAYFFYRGGRLLDQYNSCPGYFGEVSEEQKQAFRGQPELFQDLLIPAADIARVKQLLAASKDLYAFEQERMRQFAGLLGLPNAISSYEYLQNGERDEIEGWKEFVHIPDLSAEKAARRADKARIKAEYKRLQKSGVLLAELLPPKAKAGISGHSATWCSNHEASGFLVCWRHYHVFKSPGFPLMDCEPPRFHEPAETGLRFDGTIYSICTSPTGRLLAVGHAYGNWKVEVWDWKNRRELCGVPHSTAVDWLAFSPDEKLLLSGSSREIIITSLEAYQSITTLKISAGGSCKAALHPSGSHLVVNDRNNLSIVNLQSGSVEKTLKVCPKEMVFDLLPKDMDEQIVRAMMTDESVRKSISTEVAAQLEAWLAGHRQRTVQTHEGVMQLGFDPKGQLLVCATTKGLRVFCWNELLASEDETPPPRASIDTQPDDVNAGYVHDLALDDLRNRVLFCGSEGRVRYLDLVTGQAGVLLEPPDMPPMTELSLSADQMSLCCKCVPTFEERNRGIERLQIWSYPALCLGAGID